jgi:pimeloyl-ACP methyl ester carboxylesterase
MPEISVAGCKLHYEVIDLTPPWISAPETIVFHHGLGATNGIWTQWLPLLADRFRLVRFDMRGHGRSEEPESRVAVTLDLLTEDVFAVAEAAGAKRFHVVGESIGATIALNAAIRRSERIVTVTASNGAHIGASIEHVQDWRHIIDTAGMAGWSRHMMHRRFFDGSISKDMWQWYEREQASVSTDFLLKALTTLIDTDLASKLKTLDVPVLLMHADSSPFIPVGAMADLKAILPRSQLQVFARARHGLPFSHAKQCAKTLRCFLEDTSQTTQTKRDTFEPPLLAEIGTAAE